jgi:hypothetical protein
MLFTQVILGFITLPATMAKAKGRIDTHFHALPPQYMEALGANGGDPSGFKTPDWSIDAAIKAMDTIATDIGAKPPRHNDEWI